MIHLDRVTKRFGNKVAVDGFSLEVKAGEIFSLIGANGSGKTTIIKMIAGLLQQDEGSIVINGHNTLTEPLHTKGAIGYIPDEPAAWPGMTGEEFLHFIGALYEVPGDTRKKKIAELLPIFQLDGSETELFESYSRGNKQKFSILAALLHEPKVLLIDEPIVGLDVDSAQKAKMLFQEFAQSGGAVFLVTHTLPVAEAISHRIGILQHGTLITAGSLEEIRQNAQTDPHSSLEAVYSSILKS